MKSLPASLAFACMLAGCVAEGPPVALGSATATGNAGAAAPLRFCLPPVQDPDGSTRSLDLGGAGGVTEVPSRAATQGCDLMLQFAQHSGGGDFQYELSSAYSGQPFASGSVTNWVGVTSMVSGLVGELSGRVAPGTAAYNQVALERRRATGVGQRQLAHASPERLQAIVQAEQQGDAALGEGRVQDAFAAWTGALTGPWSDDDVTNRIRGKYAQLIGAHPEVLPPVPEEARRHMVRAQAILRDSHDFSGYDATLSEMAAAIIAAPWWSDCYYNAALVAEKAGYVGDAKGSLQFYLAANPHAKDARAVQDKIYALEIRQERGGH